MNTSKPFIDKDPNDVQILHGASSDVQKPPSKTNLIPDFAPLQVGLCSGDAFLSGRHNFTSSAK
jgi:hypothetical protein